MIGTVGYTIGATGKLAQPADKFAADPGMAIMLLLLLFAPATNCISKQMLNMEPQPSQLLIQQAGC
ncbi:hypothetical protein MJ575_04770 [Klebsiella pneumoniae]|nr:hypothetical protein MJ575_04770 [Klebsiella pneumoniae]